MPDPEGWASLLGTMAGSEAASGLVRQGASAFLTNLTNSPREAGSVLSTAQRHTEFLRGPAIDTALSGSDFRMSNLVFPPSRDLPRRSGRGFGAPGRQHRRPAAAPARHGHPAGHSR